MVLDFSLKNIIMHLLLKKIKKIFFEKNLIQNFKILDFIDVYQYHIHKKVHPRIPPTTLVLKYICNFSNFTMGIILSQIYSICSRFSMFVGLFRIID